jgi:predicted nuclease with TOPRIM domain
MVAKAITLQRVADLIDDLKADFNTKHKENVERRHALVNSYGALEGRVTVVETKLTSIVGDNSGGSGLLHEIRDDVKALQGEVSSIKQTVQDTPSINKWVYGAIAVVGFLVVLVPVVVVIIFEVLKLSNGH